VYKQGQAGISRASVTVIFNNSDKACSPLGYEDQDHIAVTRQVGFLAIFSSQIWFPITITITITFTFTHFALQVQIGGKNKYLINGHNAQLNRVQNLFHSVQLNVNNPHFLIMQGRIVKVMNMKPPEILALIEEAAGTRMFETKKQRCFETTLFFFHFYFWLRTFFCFLFFHDSSIIFLFFFVFCLLFQRFEND
jgi:structural maintenance of chromosome 2